jgi:hypothetical protein
MAAMAFSDQNTGKNSRPKEAGLEIVYNRAAKGNDPDAQGGSFAIRDTHGVAPGRCSV